MDEAELRRLEKHFKLRVRTGCETCRTRRVKCDETKPACTRCTKTSRICGGYKDIFKSRSTSPAAAAAAAYRNPSFLVVPQPSRQSTIPRNPSTSLSSEPQENRSFHYFKTHTLPRWTEFFESELWSQQVLQLSHSEPAIKHGILALSNLHERLEGTHAQGTIVPSNDPALVQYMQAVRHSNTLLSAQQHQHQEKAKGGETGINKILMVCIIFTSFENLAGNYQAANMHLCNGLRILEQHKRTLLPTAAAAAVAQDAIGNVLFRFDLQAMTFSDHSSPYSYKLEKAPECPRIPHRYANNSAARDDLVGLLRCLLWASGNADRDPRAREQSAWVGVYVQLMAALEEWESRFTVYVADYLPSSERGDDKVRAGNTLLEIYGIITRIIAAVEGGGGEGAKREMIWDGFLGEFERVVELAAEMLPALRARNYTRRLPLSPKTSSSSVLSKDKNQSNSPSSTQHTADKHNTYPRIFSPSFELSPILPLFICATRCRDPHIRRRALALLLNYQRREGVWDSLGAGMAASSCIKYEEGLLDARFESNVGFQGSWLEMAEGVKEADDVPECRRVVGVFVKARLAEGRMDLEFLAVGGETWMERGRMDDGGFDVGGARSLTWRVS
ncbi:hypothetical protein EJ02DRAFT_507602 [Clathrospora elynae]|uniref:Zn(2)-C6 fungal-type domain-containing protein n=1 Tax=Clathrospora elynae TaxID=706981 RepID=A0A6A5T7V3_9PLEO|nr:hypothetical protein EJ02DRAFT_507602 [Clathrospora elynae]